MSEHSNCGRTNQFIEKVRERKLKAGEDWFAVECVVFSEGANGRAGVFVDGDGFGARVEDPGELNAGGEVFLKFAFDFGLGIGLAEDFDGEIGNSRGDGREVFEIAGDSVPGNKGDVRRTDDAHTKTIGTLFTADEA